MIVCIDEIGIYSIHQLDVCIFILADDRLAPEWILLNSFYTNSADKFIKDII